MVGVETDFYFVERRLNMPVFYEMTIDNTHEYIKTGTNTAEKMLSGTWVVTFLDQPWRELSEKCTKTDRDFTRNGHLGEDFFELYKELSQQFAPVHPLIGEFVEIGIPTMLYGMVVPNVISEAKNSEGYLYREAFRQKQPVPPIKDELPHLWLRKLAEEFYRLAKLKEYLMQLSNCIFTDSGPKVMAADLQRKYLVMRTEDPNYLLALKQMRDDLTGISYWSSKGKLYDFFTDQICEIQDEMDTMVEYQTTESLGALTLWAFDAICSKGCRVYRCRNCNRLFVPQHGNRCYCDREVTGQPGETCKTLGLSLEQQKEENADAARVYFERVRKRELSQKARWIKANPERKDHYQSVYDTWKIPAKELVQQAEKGTITFEAFQEAIDSSTKDLWTKDRNKNQ